VIGGGNGKAAYSNDSGSTWHTVKLSTEKTIKDIAADDSGGFVLVGDDGTIAYWEPGN
jgi:photosystem II stability/assembly factor-like uncharacterized protein